MTSKCALLLAACCCGGVTAAALEDDSALVQSAIGAHQRRSGAFRTELLEMLTSSQLPADFLEKPDLTGPFDCKKYPLFCQAPFNCQDRKPLELFKIPLDGLSPDGKPNLQLWCYSTMYHDYMGTCLVEKDLAKAGRIQYEWSVHRHPVDEADGSYCFLEGHCSNTAVTNETTMEDAVEMCDQRYGRKGWAEMFKVDHTMKLLQDVTGFPLRDLKNGFHDSKQTTVFLKLACAMGNYHCDVAYCKETYCKNPYYVKRFSHLLPKAPGHLLQSFDTLE